MNLRSKNMCEQDTHAKDSGVNDDYTIYHISRNRLSIRVVPSVQHELLEGNGSLRNRKILQRQISKR